MSHLVSIILPVFNSEKYISSCLKSIINQSYENIEIIIVNDGSTDCTGKRLKEFNDKRINVIDQKNIGIADQLIKAL